MEIIAPSILKFAEDKGMYLDWSRKSFFERQENLIKSLSEGKLVGKNRFRELLLGLKAVGKSKILKTLEAYVENYFQSVLPIYVTYDASETLPSKRIFDRLSEKHPSTADEISELGLCSKVELSDRVESLERFLQKKNLRILLLVDEFNLVYKKKADIGQPIVAELSLFASSDLGVNHCVVSGSSTVLRRLAFAKLATHEMPDFPSYKGIDLNSTKLQPSWIFPVITAMEFRELVTKRGEKDQLLERFLCSGGRPGLVDETDVDNIAYSLTSKFHGLGEDLSSRILLSILECSSIIYDDISESEIADTADSDFEDLCQRMSPVSEQLLRAKLKELDTKFDEKDFVECVYNLADGGLIIFSMIGSTKYFSLSGGYLYFELDIRRLHASSELTWKEAAALKMPSGIVH